MKWLQLLLLLFALVIESALGVSSWFSWDNAKEETKKGDDLVSPIVNRELETSVVARDWPFTVHNVFCEAQAFFFQEPSFLDRLVHQIIAEITDIGNITNKNDDLSVEKATQLALRAADDNENNNENKKSIQSLLLRYALSLRAYSPTCEMHRVLARQTLQTQRQTSLWNTDAFALVHGQIASTPKQIKKLLNQQRQQRQQQPLLLPDEVVYGPGDNVVLLYGNMGSQAFLDFYQYLNDTATVGFVVRHLGNVGYEEHGGEPTVLQGYGVRLDIRNVEYRAFVEEASDAKMDAMVNVSLSATTTNQYLAGIDPSVVASNSKKADLWRIHHAQQLHSQILPPKWQRRQLSLQAATVVSRSKDALVTLEDVSQNLPSVASTLVHVSVPQDISTMAEHLEQMKGSLTINGRAVHVSRPSFNVFDLLRVLQEEQASLDEMHRKLSPFMNLSAMKKVQKAVNMREEAFLLDENSGDGNRGESARTRIDVGRGWKHAIVYLNDLEKDRQYRRWPRSLRQAIMSMQFGGPPAVRRNLYTFLAVVDPMASSNNVAASLATQLMSAQYPARLGILVVSEADLEHCLQKGTPGQACPTPSTTVLTSTSNLKKVEATTHAFFRLLAHVAATNVGNGVTVSYYDFFVSKLEELRAQGFTISMAHLVDAHASVLDRMGVSNHATAKEHALSLLTDDEDDDVALYGKALRFALDKGVRPGMGFMNGIVLPEKHPETSGDFFMEEQNYLFGLIMSEEINDNSPKSVYAKLLTGDAVFKKLHPLLADGATDHTEPAHGFGDASLLMSSSLSEDPKAVFAVEAVVDLASPQGVEMATTFVRFMDTSQPDKMEHNGVMLPIVVGYRIVPTTPTAACSILSQASLIGARGIQKLLSHDHLLEKSLDELLDLVDASPEARRAVRKSPVCLQQQPVRNTLVANGRTYTPESPHTIADDVELLLRVELSRSKALTKLLWADTRSVESVARASVFLAIAHGKSSTTRQDMASEIMELEEEMELEHNPLRFSWNQQDDDGLKIQVSAVLDPATETAQRVAPFLRVFRDHFRFPLQLVLAPKALLGADNSIPIASYYRFVADPFAPPKASFSNLPTNHVLTVRMDTPEPWHIQQTKSAQDSDNLRCDVRSGCSDEAHTGRVDEDVPMHQRRQLTVVEYSLKNLVIFGQCYETGRMTPPNGLQLVLSKQDDDGWLSEAQVDANGMVHTHNKAATHYSDTVVMKNVGYWQVRANPGVWTLKIAPGSRGAEIFGIVEGTIKRGKITVTSRSSDRKKMVVMKDFLNTGELLLVQRREGAEQAALFYDKEEQNNNKNDNDMVHVFSLATGRLYERLLKIMMLSVTKRTSVRVKFWLFENFLSPNFKETAIGMSEKIGCEVEFVTYKWPEWLRGQSEKQRIIWGYKILFLDVLFPLHLKKIIYVDADQVVRGDLKELWDMDLQGAPYGYTPFCTSRESTLGFQFWRGGYWENHLQGRPYHISALYVVDLENFRRHSVGDTLRSVYQQLSADPNSLANLDQDLPNYAQHQVPIFSLPQEWLWCETWCSDESKATAKTIDLCNNPVHKENKVSMAKRIISGPLFHESWVELDQLVDAYDQAFYQERSVTPM